MKFGGLRAGFTLMEVAVSAVLVGILAAATIPTLVEFVDGRDADTVAKTLSSIATGVAAFETAVRTGGAGTNTYPKNISYLTNQIVTTSLNSCNAAFGTAGTVTTYNAAAPFVTFFIPAGGLQTPLGLIQDGMTRTPGTANVGTLAIVMLAIDSIDAVRLERVIDGDDATGTNNTAGVFRITAWNGSGSATRTADVQYIMPVAAKC